MVSILTRPEGRVQRVIGPDWSVQEKEGFNPHPPRRAGATPCSRASSRPAGAPCFNPHPPRRAGATGGEAMDKAYIFQFQSSPAPKGGCNTRGWRRPWRRFAVSILTRPEGRVQHPRVAEALAALRSFNPHPPRRAGATPAGGGGPGGASQFQSSPAPKGGCNSRLAEADLSLAPQQFQSSPAPKGGCNPGCPRPGRP